MEQPSADRATGTARAWVAVLLATAFCAGACAKTSAVEVNPQNSESAVQVFYNPPTDRRYKEVGLVTTQTGQTIAHDRSAAGMIATLQQKAAAMGGDAIIVRSAKEGTWGLQGGGNTGFNRGSAQAVVIQFE